MKVSRLWNVPSWRWYFDMNSDIRSSCSCTPIYPKWYLWPHRPSKLNFWFDIQLLFGSRPPCLKPLISHKESYNFYSNITLYYINVFCCNILLPLAKLSLMNNVSRIRILKCNLRLYQRYTALFCKKKSFLCEKLWYYKHTSIRIVCCYLLLSNFSKLFQLWYNSLILFVLAFITLLRKFQCM